MPFDSMRQGFSSVPVTMRVAVVAVVWWVLISGLHCWFNVDAGQRRRVRMGYMPVITNMAAPLLDHVSRGRGDVRFEAVKFASFAEMAEALRNDDIEAAFIIAPLAIVLRQQGEDVKVVYIGNRHESTLVVSRNCTAAGFADLAGRTVAVPMRYSGHNISIRQLMEEHGLHGKIRVVEMNPPDMPAALVSGALDAYYVGEPFAAQTLKSGDARRMFFVEEVWPDFICNVMVVKQSLIGNEPMLVRMLVQGAARSGLWAGRHLPDAARIAADYWHQPAELVTYALTHPPERVVFDRFVPRTDEFQQIADLMVKQGLALSNEIGGLVDDRFARGAALADIDAIDSILISGGGGPDS